VSVCLWIILSFNITSCAFVYYQVLLYIGVVATLAVASESRTQSSGGRDDPYPHDVSVKTRDA
jgi:hypothetical protein